MLDKLMYHMNKLFILQHKRAIALFFLVEWVRKLNMNLSAFLCSSVTTVKIFRALL